MIQLPLAFLIPTESHEFNLMVAVSLGVMGLSLITMIAAKLYRRIF